MIENETETNWYTLEEFIDECQDYTSPFVMKDCVNNELDDNKQTKIWTMRQMYMIKSEGYQ